MNNKIVKAIVAVLFFGAMVAVGTFTFFSDTETSTGNTFAAGKLDLIINVDSSPLTDHIFSLTDMKPGDEGEKTVKIKVDDNPACGTVGVNLTSDLDNTCTEPEIGDEGACATSPTGTQAGSGELNDAVNFGIFADANCNNIYETDDIFLTQGTLTGSVQYHIGELGTTEKCYGVEWCFGAMTINETAHTITCNGSALNNITQTDSFSADLVVNALQKRNQFPNGCPVDGAVSPPTCTPTEEICDGKDNDCDGLITDEASACGPAELSCTDGINNDGDQAADCQDPGCFYNSLDCVAPVCGDGTCRAPLETYANCPTDCAALAPPPECTTNNDCNNDVPCTADTCVNGKCVHTPNHNACNAYNGNSCQSGTCVGTIPGADMWGCAYQVNATNIGSPCSSISCGLSGGCNGYTCIATGACVAPGGAPPPTGCTLDTQCTDADSCTSDNCSAGICYHTNTPAIQCIFGGSCSGGVVTCNPNPNCPNNCNDGNACTTDACEITGCTHTAAPNNQNCGNSAYEVCNPVTGQHGCNCYLPGVSPPCSISIPSWPF